MSDLRRPAPGAHPPLATLLAYLEHDLDNKTEEQIASHVQGCWQCMAELEDLKRGIFSFMEFREKILIPGVPIDPSVTKVLPEIAKPAREAGGARWSLLDRLLPLPTWGIPFRPTWIAALISLVVIGTLIELSLISPAPLAASEFLKHVQTALTICRSVGQDKIVRQRVRIRRGSFIAERRVIKGVAGDAANTGSTTLAWTAAMTGPITWDDPLDFDSFVRWRNRQEVLSESVSTAPDLFTLTVRSRESVREGSPVIWTVSLTVRKADWHIVSERVEREGEPVVEANEIAYEVRDRPSLGKIRPISPGIQVATSKAAAPKSLPASKASNSAKLDSVEIHVRTALFQSRTEWAGAEVTPSIRRIQNSIAVEGIISSPERRQRLHLALMSIPDTVDHISGTEAIPSATRPTRGIPNLVQTDHASRLQPAQLRELLIEKFGNGQNAAAFSDRILNAAESVFSLIAQYRDLAKRYPAAVEDALPVQARADLEDLARQIEHALKTQLQEENAALTPVLGPVAGKATDVPDRWQMRAGTLFQLASLQEKVVSPLFATTEADSPEADTPEANRQQLQTVLQQMLGLSGGK
jgi:hypothetical protein